VSNDAVAELSQLSHEASRGRHLHNDVKFKFV
jgi:hypothetical protein